MGKEELKKQEELEKKEKQEEQEANKRQVELISNQAFTIQSKQMDNTNEQKERDSVKNTTRNKEHNF